LSAVTVRQLEILAALANGHKPQQIADTMYLSKHTIINQLRDTRHRLGAKTLNQTIVLAIAYGYIVVSPEGLASPRPL
jgi:DNA-binding CsgD family transcriptional regulator